MLQNYLKVTIRNFINQKYYSIINIVGLALGIASCILILLFVQDELAFEKDFKNNEKIYRLTQEIPMGDHISKTATVPFPIKNAMLEDFPEIIHSSLVYRPTNFGNALLFKYEEDEYYEDNFIYAEHDFLEIYDFNFIKGNPSTALLEPNELILTSSISKKYFGEEDPVGKILNIGGFRDLKVIAVIQDLPNNTHLNFDIIASFETFKSFFDDQSFFDRQWVWVAAWFYFTLEDESSIDRIRADLPHFVNRHYPEAIAEDGLKLHIQNANDIHLSSHLEAEFEHNGNIDNVYLFSVIAVLILLIAIINFMNLSTSRSTKRAKEVGLRKVMGSNRRMLIFQFIGEAFLTTLLSMAIGLVVISVVLPFFNVLTDKQISLDYFKNLDLLVGVVILIIIVGILSGSYPALVLSSYNPNSVLKGRLYKNSASGFFRKILVIIQFVVSISLMICIGIIYKQLNYIQNKNLGFNTEQILIADVNFNFFNRLGTFKNEVVQIPEVKGVSMLGGSIPGLDVLIENAFVPSGAPTNEPNWFSAMFASHDFEKILNIEFLDGHSFQIGSSRDSAGYIINESAAKVLGWEKDVIGRPIDNINSNNGNIMATGEVIGLVKDFHYRPLYEKIKPLVIRFGGNKICIKSKSGNLNKTITEIEKAWMDQFENTPFRYSFMDDNFSNMYEKENKFIKTVQVFSIIAIFIACLGLLGLSSYSTENRTKEIGIRKINGASVFELLLLLTGDFSKLILLAFVIAAPLAYYAGNAWLGNFAYQTSISIEIFIISGCIAFVIAFITIGYHTIRAAIKNPVEAIRYE